MPTSNKFCAFIWFPVFYLYFWSLQKVGRKIWSLWPCYPQYRFSRTGWSYFFFADILTTVCFWGRSPLCTPSSLPSLRAGFLPLSIVDTLGWVTLLVGGCPSHYSVFSSIFGHYPLHVSSSSLFQLQQASVSRCCQMSPREAKLAQLRNTVSGYLVSPSPPALSPVILHPSHPVLLLLFCLSSLLLAWVLCFFHRALWVSSGHSAKDGGSFPLLFLSILLYILQRELCSSCIGRSPCFSNVCFSKIEVL